MADWVVDFHSVVVATAGGSACPRPIPHRVELHTLSWFTVMTRWVVLGRCGVNLPTQMLILNNPSLHSGQTFSNKTNDLTYAFVLLILLRNKEVIST